MCIIIVNEKGYLPKKEVFESWTNNPDGAGLMYALDGEIIIEKELHKKNKFWKMYLDARDKTDGAIVLHFRIGTSGEKDYNNCHPFRVDETIAFCHNGIISHTTDYKSEFSDTYLFNEWILKNLPKGFIYDPIMVELISKYVSGSKLAFLLSDGQTFIVNEGLGHWNGNNWYSNYTYKSYSYNKHYDHYSRSGVYVNNDKSYGLLKCEYCGGTLHSIDERLDGICDNCLESLKAYRTDLNGRERFTEITDDLEDDNGLKMYEN